MGKLSPASRFEGERQARRWTTRSVDWIFPSVVVLYFVAQQIWTMASSEFSSTPVDEILVVCLGYWAVGAIYANAASSRWILFLFTGYAVCNLLGVVVNQYEGIPQPLSWFIDTILDLKLFVLIFAFAYAFSASVHPERILQKIAILFVILALVNAPFVLYDLLSGGYGFRGLPLPQRFGFNQPYGLQLHQTRSVWLSAIGCLNAFYLGAKHKSIVASMIAVFLLALSVVHFSAKEAIALLMVILLFSPMARSGKYIWRLLLVALVVVIVSVSPVLAIIDEHIGNFFGSAGLDKARTLLAMASFEIARDHFPIGSGGGTFGSPPSYQLGYSNVYFLYGLENIWGASPEDPRFLQDMFWAKILGQGGVSGAIFYGAIMFIIIRRVFFSYSRAPGPETWLGLSVTIFVLAVSVASSPFTDEFLAIVFAFYAAYSMVRARQIHRLKNTS